MASFTVQTSQTFPDGTVVGAYPRTAWPLSAPPTGAPTGSPVTTATATGGQVTFAGLADNTEYVAYAASPDRYLSFRTPLPAAASAVSTTTVVSDGQITIIAAAAPVNARPLKTTRLNILLQNIGTGDLWMGHTSAVNASTGTSVPTGTDFYESIADGLYIGDIYLYSTAGTTVAFREVG